MPGPRAETGYGVGGDEGRALWFLEGLVTWKAVGADTGGRYELVEQLGAAAYAAPLHIHEHETEGFYVVSGELTMVVGELRFRAGPTDHQPQHPACPGRAASWPPPGCGQPLPRA